ncbi:MAG: cytochrome P450 [Candidatus Sericytochromatia bacterium]|nr:cytochrome P450 [Candidatus Sericytochromatia bacterium]
MAVMPAPMQRLNPFPFFAAMRQKQPVAHDALLDVWGVFRYADVRQVLHDAAAFGSDSRRLVRPPRTQTVLSPSLAGTDPPWHSQLRSLMAPAFSPEMVARLEPGIVAEVNRLLDRVDHAGCMDAVDDLADPLALHVIADMLGIPASDRPICRRWADSLHSDADGQRFAATQRPLLDRWADALHTSATGLQFGEDISYVALQTQTEMDAYFRQLIAERRRLPRADLISDLAAATIAGEPLPERDLVSFCVLLLIAGHFNMVSLIANTLWTLLEHPADLARVEADPALAASVVAEVLRYRPAVMGLARVTLRDVQVGDVTIPAGQRVVAWAASANRDETVFPEPDRFDIGRVNTASLAFGHGIHACLGPLLARVQGRLALTTTLARLQGLAFGAGKLEAIHHPILYRPLHLPITFKRR